MRFLVGLQSSLVQKYFGAQLAGVVERRRSVGVGFDHLALGVRAPQVTDQLHQVRVVPRTYRTFNFILSDFFYPLFV